MAPVSSFAETDGPAKLKSQFFWLVPSCRGPLQYNLTAYSAEERTALLTEIRKAARAHLERADKTRRGQIVPEPAAARRFDPCLVLPNRAIPIR